MQPPPNPQPPHNPSCQIWWRFASANSRFAFSTFHDVGPNSATHMDDVVNAVYNKIGDPILNAVSGDWTLDEVFIISWPNSSSILQRTIAAGVTAFGPASSLPAQVSVCIRVKIERWWLDWQRWLIAGVQQGDVDGSGRLTSSGHANWDPVAAAFASLQHSDPVCGVGLFWPRSRGIVFASFGALVANDQTFLLRRRRDRGRTAWPSYPNIPP